MKKIWFWAGNVKPEGAGVVHFKGQHSSCRGGAVKGGGKILGMHADGKVAEARLDLENFSKIQYRDP